MTLILITGVHSGDSLLFTLMDICRLFTVPPCVSLVIFHWSVLKHQLHQHLTFIIVHFIWKTFIFFLNKLAAFNFTQALFYCPGLCFTCEKTLQVHSNIVNIYIP